MAILEGVLTADLQALKQNVLNPGTLLAGKYSGGTPTGAAIRDAAHYLDNNAREKSKKIMVVMSDGMATHPSGNATGYALDMASHAASLNVKIYTVSLGDDADTGLMESIANIGGGTHFAAVGADAGLATSLDEVFRNMAFEIRRTSLVQ